VTFLPPMAALALKEWAVAVDALAAGKQIMVLRKGGIHRDDKEFKVVHPEFLLYPTFEHQKAKLLKAEYHSDLASTFDEDDVESVVTLARWCQVTDVFELRSDETLANLSPFHIWTDDYAAKRLHWRPKQPLTVLLLRVYELQQPQAVPVLDEFVGCKSWVELGQDIPLGYMSPVLSDLEYGQKVEAIRSTLEVGAAAGAGVPTPSAGE